MPISINGTGSITGLSAGGLPDASITADDIASNAVTTAKVNDAAITTAKVNDAAVTPAKLSGAQTGSAPAFAARAYVHFNGASVTNPASMAGVAASGNISSVLDNGTNDYTINFTTALPSANNVIPVAVGFHKTTVVEGFVAVFQGSQTSSSIRLQYRVTAGVGEIEQLYAAFFG